MKPIALENFECCAIADPCPVMEAVCKRLDGLIGQDLETARLQASERRLRRACYVLAGVVPVAFACGVWL